MNIWQQEMQEQTKVNDKTWDRQELRAKWYTDGQMHKDIHRSTREGKREIKDNNFHRMLRRQKCTDTNNSETWYSNNTGRKTAAVFSFSVNNIMHQLLLMKMPVTRVVCFMHFVFVLLTHLLIYTPLETSSSWTVCVGGRQFDRQGIEKSKRIIVSPVKKEIKSRGKKSFRRQTCILRNTKCCPCSGCWCYSLFSLFSYASLLFVPPDLFRFFSSLLFSSIVL